jgi:hypothetical protein
MEEYERMSSFSVVVVVVLDWIGRMVVRGWPIKATERRKRKAGGCQLALLAFVVHPFPHSQPPFSIILSTT